MGLREILTKPIGSGSSKFFWREPASYRIRLRGDGWLRLGVVLGAWALGIGLFCLLFVNNVHRPGAALAIGLGSLFGLVAAMMVFFLRDHVSGRVHVDAGEIRRYRTYAGITPESWAEWQYWPYSAIDSCAIIPASATGKSFSLLLLTFDDKRELVGVPGSVNLSKLANFLKEQGVKVTQGTAVPRPYTTKLNTVVAGVFPALGAVMLVVGMSWLLSARGNVPGNRPDHGPADRQIADRDRGPEPAANPELPGDQPAPGQNAQMPPGQQAPPQNFPTTPGFRGPGMGGQRFGFGGPGGGDQIPPGAGPGSPPPNGPGGGTGSPQNANSGKPAKSRQTEMVGAPGGFDFARSHPEGKPVIGFRSTFGSWAGKNWISRFEPLYGGEPASQGWNTVVAKPGYAVAGLLVDTPEFVNAYAVIFQQVNSDGTLNPDDSYTSDWVGPKSDQPEKTIHGDGKKVLGIHGRAGAILNAVGLLLELE